MRNMNRYILFSVAGLAITGCATSLADRTPLDIASESVRHVDSLSGQSQVYGPLVKPIMNKKSYVGAKTQLHTAAVNSGYGFANKDGSYLDIILEYTTATPDMREARQYDRVSFAGGQTAELVSNGDTVLDCRETVREVNHYPHYGYYPYYDPYWDYWGRPYRPHNPHDRHDDGDDDGDKPNGNKKRKPKPVKSGIERVYIPSTNADAQKTRGQSPNVPVSRRVETQPNAYVQSQASKPIVKSNPVSRSKPVKITRPSQTRRARRETTRTRTIDSAFKRTNNTRTRSRTLKHIETPYYPDPYYYGPGINEYEVRYRCRRQETLQIYIPKARLDDAARNGLVLFLRPRAGADETMVLPANYISGFKLAAYDPQGQSLAIERPTPPPTPPNYQTGSREGTTTQKPASSKPIIYGEAQD